MCPKSRSVKVPSRETGCKFAWGERKPSQIYSLDTGGSGSACFRAQKGSDQDLLVLQGVAEDNGSSGMDETHCVMVNMDLLDTLMLVSLVSP